MSKGPFDNIALKLTDKLFRSDINTDISNNTDVDDKENTISYITDDDEKKLVVDKALEIKKAKVYYSINLLLNESTKLLIIALLAVILQVFVKYLFCLFILILTRSVLGGLHGKSYLQCLLITVLCIGLAIYASPIIIVNYWIAAAILVIWCILVIVVGPIQSKNRLKIKEEKRKKDKIYLIVMSIVLFGITILIGWEYNQIYVFLLLFQMLGIVV